MSPRIIHIPLSGGDRKAQAKGIRYPQYPLRTYGGQPDALRSSTWLGGGHRKIDLPPVGGRGQRFASHQFDRRPILTKKACCVVVIVRFHSNAAGLSASAVRYLKVKIEADCFRIFFDRLIIAAHLVSPHFALRTLGS
jgi:hypothetical protein